MGDALAPEIAATDYHTAGEPFRIVTAGVPPIAGRDGARAPRARGRVRGGRRGAPAAVPRAARARRHVRLLPRPARRRRRRPRRAVLAQGRLLDRVRARDDRARRLGGRVGRASPRRATARSTSRSTCPRAASSRACACARRGRRGGRLPQRARRSWSRATCRPRASRSTWPTAARSTPRSPPRASGLRVVPDDLPALIAAGRAVKRALDGHRRRAPPRRRAPVGHLRDDPLRGRSAPLHQRNVTIFADGEVDRSPCGSGTSARCALLAADGRARRRATCCATTRSSARRSRARVVGSAADGRAHRGRGDGLPHRRAPLRPRPARPARHRLRPAMSLPFLDAADVAERLSPTAAIDALEAALRGRPRPGGRPAARARSRSAAASCS